MFEQKMLFSKLLSSFKIVGAIKYVNWKLRFSGDVSVMHDV